MSSFPNACVGNPVTLKYIMLQDTRYTVEEEIKNTDILEEKEKENANERK